MSRRVVQVRVSAEIVAGMLFPSFPGSWSRTDAGLPPGAKLVGRGYDWQRDCFFFVFEHESFAEVPQGTIAPEFRGVALSAFCFESPASGKAIAELNRATERQILAAEAAPRQQFDTAGGVTLPRWEFPLDHVSDPPLVFDTTDGVTPRLPPPANVVLRAVPINFAEWAARQPWAKDLPPRRAEPGGDEPHVAGPPPSS